MSTSAKASRNSAIELLRIFAMLAIVLSHICYHSGFDYTYSPLSINRLFVRFGLLGDLGVVVFVLITGYFQCTGTFRIRAFSRQLGQVWFYSITLFLLCRFGFGWEYSGNALLAVFFPTIFNEYWFFTAYMILYLLSPFLNRMLSALTRRQLEAMLTIMLLCWVVIPTVTKQSMYGSEIPQFLLFYLLGAYFRLYPDNLLKKPALRVGISLLGIGMLYGLTLLFAFLERYTPEAFGASAVLYDRNSLFILLWAVGFFAIAVYSKPFSNRFVNTVSGCTFGVYLIHENPPIRELLWKNWLHWGNYFTSGSFIPRLILSVLLVYCVCTAIDWLRQKTVAKPIENAIDTLLRRILKRTMLV